MFKKNKKFVGLDIGTTAIKMVVLKHGKQGLELEAVGALPLPGSAIVDGTIMAPVELQTVINNLLTANNIPLNSNVAIALSARTSVIRVVEMNKMTDAEVGTTLEMEGESYIASDITGLFVDHQILETYEEDGIEKIRVLIVAAKEETINEFTQAVKDVGLNPVVVDLDCFASINVVTHSYDIADKTFALIHVGHNSTTINIVRNGLFHFARSVSTGGHVLMQGILKRLPVNEAGANEILTGKTPGDLDVVEVQSIINDCAEEVALEIRRSFDFFEATNDEIEIDCVYVTGGLTNQDAILKSISEKIDKQVEQVDPFKSILVDDNDFDSEYINRISPAMVVALGLALRGVKS